MYEWMNSSNAVILNGKSKIQEKKSQAWFHLYEVQNHSKLSNVLGVHIRVVKL